MPTPKFRTSKSKRNTRRAHDSLRAPSMSVCKNCGDVKHPHVACGACGHYRGKQVMDAKSTGDFGGEDFDIEG